MYNIKFLDGISKKFETLRGAYLYKANLEGADLYKSKGVISFQAGNHLGFSYWYKEPMVKIGCVTETLIWWLENYNRVGTKENYSKMEILMYGDWLHSLDRIYRKGKDNDNNA
jgi:hypothetical protein